MQNDSKQRISFFDDDELHIQFAFKKFDNTHQKILEANPTVSSILFMQTHPQNTQPLQLFFALHDRTLACYKDSSAKVPERILELAHCKLKEISNSGTQYNHGFSLTKNCSTYEFYSPQKEIIDRWYEALKSVCVLTTFHEQYKALKMIGKGSFAKVYLVESLATGKLFAVKAFTKESVLASNKAKAKPSMLNEIELMRSFDHENIIKLYEVYESEKSIYLVIELIEGKSLQDVLRRSSFKDEHSESRVMKMIFSILDALAHLAAKGIMHRDLKPDNILVGRGDKIKIADFGLATYYDLPEYIFKKCGTPGYIAPEVLKYDQNIPSTFYDHRCDVFSAGCIFYYMLFGRPFFEGQDASQILRLNRKYSQDFSAINVIKTELKNPYGKISKEALNLLLLLLEFDPKKRITAEKALSQPYFDSMCSISIPSLEISPQDLISMKRGSFTTDYMQGSRRESLASPDLIKERFAEKDSLYLDMGKPDLNGRINTIAVGSHNHSLLIKPDSFQQVDQRNERKSLKPYHQGGNNQSFLKAAIFRNIQKNQETPDEETKDEPRKDDKRRGSDPVKFSGVERGSRGSIFSKGTNSDKRSVSSSSDSDSFGDICSENPLVQANVEKIKAETAEMRPSKGAHSSGLKKKTSRIKQ